MSEIKNRITEEDIFAVIVKREFQKLGEKTCICVLTLKNGFEVVGYASPVDKNNYTQEIGEQISYNNAVNKIWELEGYLLQQRLYEGQAAEQTS